MVRGYRVGVWGWYKNVLTTSHVVRKLFVQKGVKY